MLNDKLRSCRLRYAKRSKNWMVELSFTKMHGLEKAVEVALVKFLRMEKYSRRQVLTSLWCMALCHRRL